MAPKTNCRKHDLVAVTFLDHARGDESIQFTVYGRVVSQTKSDLIVAVWAYSDHRYKPAANDPNVHCYTIVKAAIVALTKLKPAHT